MFQDIYAFLGVDRAPEGCNIIKKRHDNLDQQGDASFPCAMAVWSRFMKTQVLKDQLEFSDQELIDRSQGWTMPIQRVIKEDDNCRVYFNRTECLRKYFERRQEDLIPSRPIPVQPPIDTDINTYRRRIANDTLDRILTVFNDPPRNYSIPDHESIKVGSCFDSETKKPFPLSYLEYLAKRSTDMQLIAQHKYGMRVQNEKYLRDLVETLGAAAVVVDLLEAKTSGPVYLAAKSNIVANTSSKGAAFILYNSARIETLFRVFNERVQSGYYPPLPATIDYALLKQEDEWKLFYNYLIEYDEVLQRTVRGKDIQIHNLCGFLYKLVGQFSVYYRRTKILTVSLVNILVTWLLIAIHFQENRPHLMPVLHAKITLLKDLRRILNELLFILGIAPVQQM